MRTSPFAGDNEGKEAIVEELGFDRFPEWRAAQTSIRFYQKWE